MGLEVRPRTGQTHSPPFELDERFKWGWDETYIAIRGVWKYLYRAVDSASNTLDFMPSAKQDGKAVARFFRKVLKAQHTQAPRVVTVDKNAAYPVAMETLKGEETLPETTELRQVKYLNNRVEQDHKTIRQITRAMIGFKSFNSARKTLREIEARNMIRKGQVQGVKQGDGLPGAKFIGAIFEVNLKVI